MSSIKRFVIRCILTVKVMRVTHSSPLTVQTTTSSRGLCVNISTAFGAMSTVS
ncbi:hypothetical protein SBDP1_1210018 [Syntrophobacter sp. SbD1]|nr:hypothetical protein SBDP1_1210018 [Syntrophobacter sp. SbD1]